MVIRSKVISLLRISDLICNKIISYLRKFLESREFMEVETPILSPSAGGANAVPFVTHAKSLDRDLFLRIAPELYLKVS